MCRFLIGITFVLFICWSAVEVAQTGHKIMHLQSVLVRYRFSAQRTLHRWFWRENIFTFFDLSSANVCSVFRTLIWNNSAQNSYSSTIFYYAPFENLYCLFWKWIIKPAQLPIPSQKFKKFLAFSRIPLSISIRTLSPHYLSIPIFKENVTHGRSCFTSTRARASEVLFLGIACRSLPRIWKYTWSKRKAKGRKGLFGTDVG